MAFQKVTAGRDALGAFAPKFAQLNDDVLFGEVWSRENELSPRDRSLITVTALMASGMLDSSFKFHLTKARENGVTKQEIAEAFTQLAFYAGWPKAWAAFRMALEVWDGEETAAEFASASAFPLGEANDAFAKYFTGKSYLSMLTTDGLGTAHVSFEPGCRNWWHIHHGGGQILLVTGGRGWYQERGKQARELRAGDAVDIPPEVEHWHGAAADSWFSHIAIGVPAEGGSTEWVAPVTDEEYGKLS